MIAQRQFERNFVKNLTRYVQGNCVMIVDKCVSKNTAWHRLANVRGAPRCRERPAFVLQTRGIRWKCRGFAIRYSLLTSSPLTPSPSSLYSVWHRDPLLYDPHMCFVCTRHVTYGPCIIYHIVLAADREWDVRCIQQALRLRRSA